MIKISNRLKTVASLVDRGLVLADVGTDHAYVPIWLIQQKKIPYAIAMDINSGPLGRAAEHIALYGMDGYIETRLSDGVAALAPGEAGAVLVAGMGGGLMMHILETGKQVCRRAEELVLQPQSELYRFREYLLREGYVTDAEELVEEDGKYYPMMRVHYEGARAYGFGPEEELFHTYGRMLLRERHPVLKEYLLRERNTYQKICEKLKQGKQSASQAARREEVLAVLGRNTAALSYYSQE